MGAKDILSKDEIDALLHSEDSTDAVGGVPEKGVRGFDFDNQERVVQGRPPTLEMINERFINTYRVSVSNILRRTAEVTFEGIQMIKFSEYIQSLSVPSSLTLTKMLPFKGTCLFMLDPKLVFTFVDNFFGGDGRYNNKIEGRDFSRMEMRIIQMILEPAVDNFKEAWKPVMEIDFELQSHEMNPHLANIVSPDEIVVISSFNIELEGGGGELHLVIPYNMIEPIRNILNSGVSINVSEKDEHWNHSLRDEVFRTKVELQGILAETSITVKELSELKDGDIIPFDMPDNVTLFTSGLPLYKGHYGQSRGNQSVKVEEIVKAEDMKNIFKDLKIEEVGYE
jgi:flagellar motor switch protein FliM